VRSAIRRFALLSTLALLGAAAGIAVMAQQAESLAAPAADAIAAVRFASLDIVINSPEPLAAWQFELTDRNASMLIVGVENGDSPAFGGAPYFDLDAVQSGRAERIIVADFNAARDAALPSGTTRIATVHVRYDAQTDPEYALRLVAAGNAAGEPIAATIRIAN
jgi:hypothetical protein